MVRSALQDEHGRNRRNVTITRTYEACTHISRTCSTTVFRASRASRCIEQWLQVHFIRSCAELAAGRHRIFTEASSLQSEMVGKGPSMCSSQQCWMIVRQLCISTYTKSSRYEVSEHWAFSQNTCLSSSSKSSGRALLGSRPSAIANGLRIEYPVKLQSKMSTSAPA